MRQSQIAKDMIRRRRLGKKKLTTVLVCVSMAVIVLAACRRPLLVAYHRRAAHNAFLMTTEVHEPSAFKQFFHELLGDSNFVINAGDRYEHHRDRLVELGALVHHEFVFKYLHRGSKEANEVWRRVWRAFPENIYVEGETMPANVDYSKTKASFIIKVWDSPEMIPEWRRFVEKHDVPDFRERFMNESAPKNS